ncbi:MAG: alpha/beta hydrolase fold domain-containing protein [Cetobacterium sp.]|uniref:alpha/beta hydrolase fold domain-containing protein n=2 Tax=Cetobacterium sp. TaxID=2071632 RepID=UPI003F357ECE
MKNSSKPLDWHGDEIFGPASGNNPHNDAPNVDYVKNKFLNIPYAEISNSQKLDIYMPNIKRFDKCPVIINIHGGAFFGGDKYDGQLKPMLEALNEGFAVVSINYRLSPEERWPAQIEDVMASIDFIKKNSDFYGLDNEKIILWGGSAGGHLSALAGVLRTDILAVIDWFGPINFLTMDEQWKKIGIDGEKHNHLNSFESFLMRAQITRIPEIVKKTNPETYITRDLKTKFFIQHGLKDSIIPYLQSKNFSDELSAYIGSENVYYEELPEAVHGDRGGFFSSKENLEKIFNFIKKYL